MRNRLKLLRNAVIAAGIITALGVGANEASGCEECNPPPDEYCGDWPGGDAYCNHWCINIQYCEYGGMCPPSEFCLCYEK